MGNTSSLKLTNKIKAPIFNHDNTKYSSNDQTTEKLLCTAILEGNVNQLQKLINQGANLNYPCKNEFFPLGYACKHGNENLLEIVKMLVENGAELESLNQYDHTPMMSMMLNLNIAYTKQQTKIVKYLISKGANVNFRLPLTDDDFEDTPLAFATLCRLFDIVKLLLKNGAKISPPKHPGTPIIFIALAEGSFEIADLLLKFGADIDTLDHKDMTPLLYAIEYGKTEVVKSLIFRGADVNMRTPIKQMTPLGFAIVLGHLDIVKILHYEGASLYRSHKGWPLKYYAVKYGHTDVLNYFFEQGETVKVLEVFAGDPLFHIAMKKGHFEVAKCLIENEVPIDGVDQDFMTPLKISVKSGSLEMVKFLISKGANLDHKTCGKTALGLAIYNDQFEIATILIENGASVKYQHEGRNLVDIVMQKENYELAKLLVEKGSEFEPELYYKSLFEKSHFYMVKYFIQLETNNHIQKVDIFYVMFLYCLKIKRNWSKEFSVEFVNYLMENGFQINKKRGMSPIFASVMCEQYEIAKQLIKHGSNINVQEEDKDTALHQAVMIRNNKLCKLLLDYGANYEIRGESNLTPFEMAKIMGLDEIIDLIVEKMAPENQLKDGVHVSCIKVEDCVICYTPRKEVFMFHPCGHAKTCERCSLKIMHKSWYNPTCPVCRANITNVKKVFL